MPYLFLLFAALCGGGAFYVAGRANVPGWIAFAIGLFVFGVVQALGPAAFGG
jgi:hypothetical protein